MVKIRMQRMGSRKNPQYVIVATTDISARDGKFLEKLGFYNPKFKDASKRLTVNLTQVDSWIKKGAQCSLTVSQLLTAQKTQSPKA